MPEVRYQSSGCMIPHKIGAKLIVIRIHVVVIFRQFFNGSDR